MFTLVGLTGVARSGKDTAGKILIDLYGFKRLSFADPLREMLYALNPIIEIAPRSHFYRVQTLVNAIGWESAKDRYSEVRKLLQRLGTEAGREVLGHNIWIQTAFNKYRMGDRVVITDVRYDNEARAVLERGGVTIKIERPGYAPVNSHASDAGVAPNLISHTIVNDGTMTELGAKLIRILRGDQNGR